MADKLFQAKTYLSYWLDAVDEHSLHSPFFFDLYTKVIKNKATSGSVPDFERLRGKLLADKRVLKTPDPGSKPSKPRSVSSIAQSSLSSAQFSGLYARMIHHFKARVILELGTSLGINTLYLAQQKESTVTTFEGAPGVAEIARLTFKFAHAANIRLVEGNLDHTLSEFLQTTRKIDFVFMDANHRYQPTLAYFESLLARIGHHTIIVLDDIHYSREMENAWYAVKNHELVYGSADLYRCGMLFFDPSLNKQHVILQV